MNSEDYEIDEVIFLLGYDEDKSEVPSSACEGQAPNPV
jgi:hypothetical protein